MKLSELIAKYKEFPPETQSVVKFMLALLALFVVLLCIFGWRVWNTPVVTYHCEDSFGNVVVCDSTAGDLPILEMPEDMRLNISVGVQ